ncbi:MAG: glucokinase [Deltaproteobacteria bacterium]|nr:glucokinase [Deltaproteobacteria bacterium]
MILAGDCGGTKTNLALYRLAGKRLLPARFRSFPSREYPSLPAIIADFLRDGARPGLASVGAAGPVRGGEVRFTNLSWVASETEIRRACGASRVYLINDLQATAFSIPFLSRRDVAVVQPGRREPRATIAVVAAGTGLGQAFLVRAGDRLLPVATEGGHVDFAPRNEREFRLLGYLQSRYGHVSAERVVSGPGLHAVYRFVTEAERVREVPPVAARFAAEDAPFVIAQEGQGRRSRACREALRLFVSLYGAVAGNAALQGAAAGGVYLAGGLAPAVLPLLRRGPFLSSFRDKGRFRDFLAGIPVRAILSGRAVLVGAARYALAREEEGT